MKTNPSLNAAVSLLVLSLAFAWLAGGCTAPSGGSSAPKPGSGIAEYRDLTRLAHRSVVATVKSLESLAQPSTQTVLQHPALPGFDRAFHQLELTSIKTRARAEAIIARGQTYFEEWRENLSAITNRTTSHVETARYDRLRVQFEMIRERSREVREEFRPYMANLREFRARLDAPVNPAGKEPPAQKLDQLAASGRRVLKALEAVGTELDAAEVELRATLVAGK